MSGLHPELRRTARFLPREVLNPITTRLVTAGQRRAARRGSGGRAPVRVFRPARPTGAALVWIHGGGYVMGSARMDDRTCRWYADELGAVVHSVDYRLAPVHPFPAALDDCHRAVLMAAADPDVDPARIVVGGASAGGGLAAATALRVRDRGDVDLAAQVLLYPMLDDRTTGPDLARDDHRLWSARSNAWAWRAYLGGADPRVAVPARCDDLAGLPPTWIGVGTADLFHDEDVAFAGRLGEAGVATTLEVVPGAFHAFDMMVPRSDLAGRFRDSQVTFLTTALAARS